MLTPDNLLLNVCQSLGTLFNRTECGFFSTYTLTTHTTLLCVSMMFTLLTHLSQSFSLIPDEKKKPYKKTTHLPLTAEKKTKRKQAAKSGKESEQLGSVLMVLLWSPLSTLLCVVDVKLSIVTPALQIKKREWAGPRYLRSARVLVLLANHALFKNCNHAHMGVTSQKIALRCYRSTMHTVRLIWYCKQDVQTIWYIYIYIYCVRGAYNT